MSSTTAPMIPLNAKRPTAPQKPAPSRTPYRPAADTTFGAALRAAANEAMMARLANPNASRIGAPVGAADAPMSGAGMPGAGLPGVGLPGAGLPGVGMPGTAMPGTAMANPSGMDARLWESLNRGAALPNMVPGAQGAQGARTAMAGRAEQLEPAVQALTPAMIREQGQTFLRSIKGSDQTSVSEYESVSQAKAWGGSTCSAAALTAVLRAAGQDVKISDVMKEMPGGMTIALGLVSRPSLVNAANQFGAGATDDVKTYEGLKQATDNGQPVIVSIRNAKFPEGHFIVVTGVDDNGIQCADSSRYNLTSISRSELLRSWDSRGIRIEGFTPSAAPLRGNAKSA